MTTVIRITFRDESAFAAGKRPSISIDGPAQIPGVGEHVHCSSAMGLEDPVRISGTVVSRIFRYESNEVHVTLSLEDNYPPRMK